MQQEKHLISIFQLQSQIKSLVIHGPPQCGKKTTLKKVLDELKISYSVSIDQSAKVLIVNEKEVDQNLMFDFHRRFETVVYITHSFILPNDSFVQSIKDASFGFDPIVISFFHFTIDQLVEICKEKKIADPDYVKQVLNIQIDLKFQKLDFIVSTIETLWKNKVDPLKHSLLKKQNKEDDEKGKEPSLRNKQFIVCAFLASHTDKQNDRKAFLPFSTSHKKRKRKTNENIQTIQIHPIFLAPKPFLVQRVKMIEYALFPPPPPIKQKQMDEKELQKEEEKWMNQFLSCPSIVKLKSKSKSNQEHKFVCSYDYYRVLEIAKSLNIQINQYL